MPIHEFFGMSYDPNFKFIFIYTVLVLVVLLVLYIKHRLTQMPIGRAWEALLGTRRCTKLIWAASKRRVRSV